MLFELLELFKTNSGPSEIPTSLSIVGGLLFIAFMSLSLWRFYVVYNNRRPRHETEGLPFFKRAFAEGKPVLWAVMAALSLLTSISFFWMI